MFVYKKLKASDASRTPFEAHKQYNITANNTSSLGIDFFSARFSSSSKDTFSLNDPNQTKKYFQLDKIYYNKDFGNNIGGLEYEDQDVRLYKKLNVISIPQGIFGSSIQKGTLNLFETYTDDSKGNIYNSSLTLTNYPTDKERVFYLAPVKGFKLSDLTKNYNTGYNLVNPPSTLDKAVYDDSLYLNTVEYISSSITHLSSLNCTGIDLSSGYVKVPHSNNINFGQNQNFTVSFYYKTPTLSGTKYLVAKSYSKTTINSPENGKTNTTGSLQPTEVDAGNSFPFEIYLTNNQINFARADQNIISLATSSAVLSNDTLYHISCVKSGSDLKIYLNGELTGSNTDNTVLTKNKANLYIGNRGGTRSEYSSAGGTLSQLMIFNKALNNTQVVNVSSSITGLPYIGNIFYENGLITITSPKYTNDLGSVNESLSTQITISPTYGTADDFDLRLLESTGNKIFNSSFRAYNFTQEEENLYDSSSYSIIDFSNTSNLGPFISSSNNTGDPVVGEYSLFSPQESVERNEYFNIIAFQSELHTIGGFLNIPTLLPLENLFSNKYVHVSSSTGGFSPTNDSTSITINSDKWVISASESTTQTLVNIQASASRFIQEDNFPSSDTSLSDTIFAYSNDTSADNGILYLENFEADGLAVSSSLEDMPSYTGFTRRSTDLAGTSANGYTLIRTTFGDNSDGNDYVEFRDNGPYNTTTPGGDILITDIPNNTEVSASFRMTVKLTNSDQIYTRNGVFRIVSGSTMVGYVGTFQVPPNSSTPVTYNIFANNIGLNVNDSYEMQIDMNGNSQLTMTEAKLEIFAQTPTQGKRNSIVLKSDNATAYSFSSDRTRRYLVNVGEIHTSASNNASGPNHSGLLTGSLYLGLYQSIQGTVTELTSSIIPSGSVSSSFIYLYNPGDINNSGTTGTSGNTLNTAGSLYTKFYIVNPNTLDEDIPFKIGPNEGFTIRDFSIKEISGSTTVVVDQDLTGATSITTNENILFENPISPTDNTNFISIDTVDSSTEITSLFPILTIDATGSLISVGGTGSAVSDPTQISASFEATASENGVYVLSGLDIDSNFGTGLPRIRIYSGSTLISSSFGSSIDLIGINNYSRLQAELVRYNNTNDLPSGNSVNIGYIPKGQPFKIELDVVESDGTTLKPTPSNESASFSGLGVYYLTSSTQMLDNSPAVPNWSNEYNSIQVKSPHTSTPFTTGNITASIASVGASTVAILNSPLFITASSPATQSNTFTAVPFVVEKTYNLGANSRYIISQSLNYNFANGNRLIWRIARTEDESTPINLGDHNYDFISDTNNIFSNTENQWVTASATIDTTTGGEYKSQFLMYNLSPNFTDKATVGDFLKLSSASLEEYAPTVSIVRTGGDLFSETDLESITLKIADNTAPLTVGNSNPQTYLSTSAEVNPPATDEFTFQNASLIQLNSPILVLDGEITGSEGNVYAYYKQTSSINIVSGFSADMEGGVITNLGAYSNTFNISEATNNTMSIDNEVLLLNNTTATVNYVTGGSIDDFNLEFKNTHLIFEHEYQCTVEEDEYNFSLNPTLRLNQDIEEAELANFATGSNFKPYVTTIGLYNEEGELLVVGKLGQPIKMSDETDTTFVVRFDT